MDFKARILKWATKIIVGIDNAGFDQIVAWIIEYDAKDLKGLEKFEEVIRLFSEKWGDRFDYFKRFAVQAAYAWAKITGKIQ